MKKLPLKEMEMLVGEIEEEVWVSDEQGIRHALVMVLASYKVLLAYAAMLENFLPEEVNDDSHTTYVS